MVIKMSKKNKLRLKKPKLHPVTIYIILIVVTVIASGILSAIKFQTTYSTVSPTDLSIVQNTVGVQNLFNYDGLKYMISNAALNFISFAPLSMLIITSIGVSVLMASGFMDFLSKHLFSKINVKVLTFLIIFIGTISTIINDIGYVILIPIAASIYETKGRNPLSGVIAAFCGVAFGSGTTIFAGSAEVNLIPYTTTAARLVDETFHVSLLSNLFIMIASTIILSIVGTVIVEKIVVPRFGKLKEKKDDDDVEVIESLDDEAKEQERLNIEYKEKRGFRYAMFAGMIMLALFIYSVIPNLPLSGMLLDMNEDTYLKQIFGANSYFQDGFTYMTSLLFITTGLGYGIGSKKFKNDRDVFEGCHENLKNLGGILIMIFFAAQFIFVFRKTNIGTILTGIVANIIDSISFGGIPLLAIAILLIAFSNLFLTTPQAKWAILAPVIVPPLMQFNIAPQFLQFVLRAADSMTNGITPLSTFFVIFIAFLNMYNKDKDKPIGIFGAIRMILPYCLIISVTWLLILIGWYIIGLPIGPGVLPTI